jgi:hypothetical protein
MADNYRSFFDAKNKLCTLVGLMPLFPFLEIEKIQSIRWKNFFQKVVVACERLYVFK